LGMRMRVRFLRLRAFRRLVVGALVDVEYAR
jgi:hypothetical protein